MGMGNVATVNTLNSVKEPTGACAHVQYVCTMLINKFALYAYASIHKKQSIRWAEQTAKGAMHAHQQYPFCFV